MLIAGSAVRRSSRCRIRRAGLGTVNVVGRFLVADRMLDMFKRKPEKEAD